MKIYFGAGLKELSKKAGFRGETLTSLEKTSNFKRTHMFIPQVWEALYAELLQMCCEETETNILQLIKEALTDIDLDGLQPSELLLKVENVTKSSDELKHLREYVQEKSNNDDTWKFWDQFIFQDCLANLCLLLYLSIRCNNWQLRQYSLKLMAPLFAAFDHQCYSKIIPHHLAQIQLFPESFKQCFENGLFTVSIKGEPGHSVAFDEAHEMLINKEMKGAVKQPTKAYLQKTLHFLKYRIEAHKHASSITTFAPSEREACKQFARYLD